MSDIHLVLAKLLEACILEDTDGYSAPILSGLLYSTHGGNVV